MSGGGGGGDGGQQGRGGWTASPHGNPTGVGLPGTGPSSSVGVSALSVSPTLSDLATNLGHPNLGQALSPQGTLGQIGLALGTTLAGTLPGTIAGMVSKGQSGVPGGYAPPSSGLSAGQGDPGLPGDFGFGDAASGPAEDLMPSRPMPEIIPPRQPTEVVKRDRVLQAAAPSYTGPPKPAVDITPSVAVADIVDEWDRTEPTPTDIDILQAIRERLGGASAVAEPDEPETPIAPSAFVMPRTAAAKLIEPPRRRLRLPRV